MTTLSRCPTFLLPLFFLLRLLNCTAISTATSTATKKRQQNRKTVLLPLAVEFKNSSTATSTATSTTTKKRQQKYFKILNSAIIRRYVQPSKMKRFVVINFPEPVGIHSFDSHNIRIYFFEYILSTLFNKFLSCLIWSENNTWSIPVIDVITSRDKQMIEY